VEEAEIRARLSPLCRSEVAGATLKPYPWLWSLVSLALGRTSIGLQQAGRVIIYSLKA
jgi:hypothetical protein